MNAIKNNTAKVGGAQSAKVGDGPAKAGRRESGCGRRMQK